jgi:deoxycytidine triphosphate deaminase
MDLPDSIAETEDQAQDRYEQTRSLDPFPDIPPALLNSADVEDYVRSTGMIFPFARDRLKASSYRVSIGDRCIYWDKNGNDYDLFLREGEHFTLEQNSIAFVTTRERFRLPLYIGARFNLRIKNVHRGLLVGTGPLVDPGFSGRLLVPLHNLTTMTMSSQRARILPGLSSLR